MQAARKASRLRMRAMSIPARANCERYAASPFVVNRIRPVAGSSTKHSRKSFSDSGESFAIRSSVGLVMIGQVYTERPVEQPRGPGVRGAGFAGRPMNFESKGMHMKSSHQVHLEMIEHALQPASCFQLQAAKHKVLVIGDAIADDKEYCEALLLKIDHLLSQETVPPVSPSTGATVASPASSERIRSAA